MILRGLAALAVGTGVVLAGIGVVAAPAVVAGAVGLGGVVGVMVANTGRRERSGPTVGPDGWRGGVPAGAGAAVALLAVVGLITVLGTASGVVLLVLGLLAGPVIWLRWRRPSAQPVAPAGPVLPDAVPSPATASTAQLCTVWQRSYFAMVDLPAGPRRDELALLRRGLLDELERRDPVGFGRWLETGARANSDPGRYLAPGR